MKYADIIDILRESAYDVAIKLKTIYPSKIIAMCLYRYEKEYVTDEDILTTFNPFGVLNPSTLEKVKYSSLCEGVINGLDDDFIINNIPEERVDRIVKVWGLSQYDIAYFKTIDIIIIDLDDNQKIPFIDQYTVTKNNSVILTTSSLEEVLEMLEKDKSLQITNSKGKLINYIAPDNEYSAISNISTIATDLTAGTKVVCENLSMYNSPTDSRPTRSITGVYYIYTGKEVNGMYQVCQKKIINDNDVVIPLGYVKGSQLTQ